MRIEVISVAGPTSQTKGSNSYETLEVAYKTSDGRVQGKKLVSFQNQPVFELLSKAKQGQSFDVTAVKDGKYWNWTEANPASGPEKEGVVPFATASKGGRVTGNNYETPEERADNRKKIIRQNCIGNAIAFAEAQTGKTTLEAVLKTAEQLEAWVNRNEGDKAASATKVAKGAMDGMKDDIPF